MKILSLSIIICFGSLLSAFSEGKTSHNNKPTSPKTSIVSKSPVKTGTTAAKTATVKPGTTTKVSVSKSVSVASKTSTVKKGTTTKKSVTASKTSVKKQVVSNSKTAASKNEANSAAAVKTVTKNSPLVAEKSKTYPYLAYTPQGYEKNSSKEWPIIIYLHGSSCKGSNLEKLKKYGPPFYLERGMQVDAIVISPQCPSNKNWTVGSWFESFYKELKEKYNFDPSRVYLTGMSLGGFGTWDLASRYPDYFAAIVPLCGGGRTNMVEKMKDIPTWVFHGDLDKKVRLSRSEEMVNAMKEQGSTPKFSVLKGQGHSIQKVYSDQSLYEWLLSHQKRAYERILEISSFWTPKIDSVDSKGIDPKKSLVQKIFPNPDGIMDKKKGVKSSIFDMFTKKPSYTQETLY